MGPIILFDKSALQALSVNESVWFDHFFIPVISPLFFIETLADLEKAVSSSRTPEAEVGLIGAKTPEMSGSPTVFHLQLCLQDLFGYSFPMNGRIPVAGGVPIKTQDRGGFRFDISPESKAFARWQEGKFLEVERQFAKRWRSYLRTLDFRGVIQHLNSLGFVPDKCRTLQDAKDMADIIVNHQNRPLEFLTLVFSLLSLPMQLFTSAFQRYSLAGYPPLTQFAPYTAYVLTVELFFYIAISKGLISSERRSNKVDISYICYLPFCTVFTSFDRLHRRCVPLFLRNDQEFLWGANLKDGLGKINNYFSQFPESEREKGLSSLAPHPPRDPNFLITQLWDRHLPRWRSLYETPFTKDEDGDARLIKHLREFNEAQPITEEQINFDPSDPDVMCIQRRIQRYRGDWWQVPKDLK
jgi:hypothetical protein